MPSTSPPPAGLARASRPRSPPARHNPALGITRVRPNSVELWNRLSSGSYFPAPVRAVEIPKKHGEGKVRILGVPTVADRIAQTVVRLYLEPKVEPGLTRRAGAWVGTRPRCAWAAAPHTGPAATGFDCRTGGLARAGPTADGWCSLVRGRPLVRSHRLRRPWPSSETLADGTTDISVGRGCWRGGLQWLGCRPWPHDRCWTRIKS